MGIGKAIDKVIDADDRRAIGSLVVIAGLLFGGIVGAAATLGLALRVFEAVSG